MPRKGKYQPKAGPSFQPYPDDTIVDVGKHGFDTGASGLPVPMENPPNKWAYYATLVRGKITGRYKYYRTAAHHCGGSGIIIPGTDSHKYPECPTWAEKHQLEVPA
jgi:hypothetical protein